MKTSPQRIVCLSAEVADWLWRIGAWDQVVGVTAFFKAPENAPSKPRVSGFSSGNLQQIEQLNPDLIILFSDVQATLAAELIRRGLPVLATNQRTIAEIEHTLALIARMVNREAGDLLDEFRRRLAPVAPGSAPPRVYFEEWNEPMIYGIAWVGELIERAGGQHVFGRSVTGPAARNRVVTSHQVHAANPDLIIASWCGKPVSQAEIAGRPGWSDLTAVRRERIYEIPSEDILQPGYRLIHGFERLKEIIQAC